MINYMHRDKTNYNVEKKENQYEKNRCFLVLNVKNSLPLGKIQVTELYKHKSNAAIIICSKNGVRKNTKSIWGNYEVISIKKKIPYDFIKQSMAEASLYENESDEVTQLEAMKQTLIEEKRKLIKEINDYGDKLRDGTYNPY